MRIPTAVVGHATTRAELQAFADATTLVDVAMLRSRRFPKLYESGVRYRAEVRGGAFPGVERFQTVDSSNEVRFDDCDGLASWRAAELIVQGIRARAYVVRSPGVGWHVVTLWWDREGRMHLEDPSARLGMLGGSMHDEEDDTIAAVRIERGHATMVTVGAVLPGGVATAARGISIEEPDDDDDEDEPSEASQRKRTRRRRARAASRAFGRLASQAARIVTSPARVPNEVRREAERITRRATEARDEARSIERDERVSGIEEVSALIGRIVL